MFISKKHFRELIGEKNKRIDELLGELAIYQMSVYDLMVEKYDLEKELKSKKKKVNRLIADKSKTKLENLRLIEEKQNRIRKLCVEKGGITTQFNRKKQRVELLENELNQSRNLILQLNDKIKLLKKPKMFKNIENYTKGIRNEKSN